VRTPEEVVGDPWIIALLAERDSEWAADNDKLRHELVAMGRREEALRDELALSVGKCGTMRAKLARAVELLRWLMSVAKSSKRRPWTVDAGKWEAAHAIAKGDDHV
jgi:hypothetical protein